MGREPVDFGGIECALEDLARHVGQYVNRSDSSDGGNCLQLYTGPSGSGFYPVLLEFQGESQDVLERIATAFERIADAMTAGKGEAAK